MKKQIIFSIIIIISIINLSCSNSSTNPQPLPNSAVFPNTLGDRWVYAVYDSLNSKQDTLTVQVSSILTTSGNKHLFVWTYTSNSGVNPNYSISGLDTAYYYSGQDTVYSYYDNKGTQIESKYAFPLQVGFQWKNNSTGLTDISQVTEQQTVNVPAGSFPNTFHILRNKNGLNDYITLNIWFKERTGIVKLYMHETGFVFRTFTWNLISYSVN